MIKELVCKYCKIPSLVDKNIFGNPCEFCAIDFGAMTKELFALQHSEAIKTVCQRGDDNQSEL